MMTPLELDGFRAQLIATNKALAMIVCGAPAEFVFDGRRGEPELGKEQLRFNEKRLRFITSKNSEEVRRLAVELPRSGELLRRASTGWRDRQGVLHRYGVYAPPMICPHGLDLYMQDCAKCAADDAETDAI